MSTLHLDKLLNPRSIVVIGASDRAGSPGYALTSNIINGGYTGKLCLVNPRYTSVCGLECLRSLGVLRKKLSSQQSDTGSLAPPDLAIILTPERLVKRTLIQTAKLGIHVAIVMSSVKKSAELHTLAQKLKIRLLGPYCAGIIRPHLKLNATYSSNTVSQGNLAIVSQSASLAAAILDWAEPSGVGFSILVSAGYESDVALPDLLDLLAEDSHTRAIICYLDRMGQTRSFLSAISAVARVKPVLLMKSAQDSARYCDALTQTGQVYSSDHIFQAAMQRAGVVRIRTFSNLFSAAKILTSRVRIQGKRLAIISNGSAPAMLALERLISKGFCINTIQPDMAKSIVQQLKPHAKATNPLLLRHPELLAEQYQKAIQLLQTKSTANKTTTASAFDFDAILVIFIPDARNHAIDVANAIISCAPSPVPILTCFMGDATVASSRSQLVKANFPTFRTPEAATDALDFLRRYLQSQRQLVQLPNPASRQTRADVATAKELIKDALDAGERVLGPQKTRRLLALFNINVLNAKRVTSKEEAVKHAQLIGYPVAMKLVSPNIRFKSEVAGIELNLANDQQLLQAYDRITTSIQQLRPDAEYRGVLIEAMYTEKNSRSLAMSLTRDASFGPVISVGIGGELSAILNCRAVQLPPLNNYLIDELLAAPDLVSYMGNFRHSNAVNKAPAARALRQLSEMACELPDLFSIDINPINISEQGAVAIDVQVVLEKSPTLKRYAHLAIHPYPWQWMRLVKLKHGKTVHLRPIRPEDGESINNLVRNMSAQSRYFRFMHAVNELSPQLVAQFTKLDYDRQMAVVAVSDSGGGDIVGVSRYTINNDKVAGEFAIAIVDDWQGQGLSSALIQLIIEHAKEHGLEKLVGDVLRSNQAMKNLMLSKGFTFQVSEEDRDVLVYTLALV